MNTNKTTCKHNVFINPNSEHEFIHCAECLVFFSVPKEVKSKKTMTKVYEYSLKVLNRKLLQDVFDNHL
jgi:hypothetical protein